MSYKQIFTALVVVVLLLNVETTELALFINAIGVDVFLVLIEVQLVALVAVSYHRTFRPVVNFFLGFSAHPFILPTWNTIKHYPDAIAFVFPPGAIMMFLLFSGAAAWALCRLAS